MLHPTVLQHLVVAGGNVRSTDLSDELVIPSTLSGDPLRIQLPGSNGSIDNIVDGSENAENEVIVVDVLASNGVIHILNSVLIPDLE